MEESYTSPPGTFAKSNGHEKLTFDDIDLNGKATGFIPGNYGGLSWFGLAVMNTAAPPGDISGPGFVKGTKSGDQIAYLNSTGQIQLPTVHGTFTFDSVRLTAGTDRQLVVTIFGIHNNSVVWNETITLTDRHSVLFAPHWTLIDEIFFKTSAETPDPRSPSTGPYVVLDNLVVGAFDPNMAATRPTSPTFARADSAAFGEDAHHSHVVSSLHSFEALHLV